ncbi:hypothetical protein IDJ77_03965 [Mucilaginibacter sp. ZT4R22]|uniref:TerB family tellurite resistance protein n=1 Tax=Mucilaginibacter pankratovii TaxID=2772110 RepID=A0ABR7WNS1_9SPHI|nr:hypothetical protein [Mucilaginibacter pankratovii]MBD1362957.1 hypothetical protein [Mucilaginibacter pankratovii]
MDCIKLTCFFLLFGTIVRAQTFAEWFKQKNTQKKYLYQQIAALQIYSGYLQKGYRIAKGGLGTIGDAVGNEYDLHRSYYTHLSKVNIVVKNNPQVNDIIRWQQDILIQTRDLKNMNGLTGNEALYVSKVCEALLSDCDARLNDLQTIMTDQKIKMSDEERMRQIGRLHLAMQDNYRFAATFRSQLQLFIRSKKQENRDINTLNHLYENR